jgi:DNA-binding IclR family transcriptional regulator
MSSSARRSLHILETIGRSPRPIGVTEIARAMRLPAGTVFRSLDALLRAGLVARYQASSRYVIGSTVERLRRSLLARFRMREAVLPYLHQLASVSGETASLHVRLGWYGLRVASALGTGEVANAPVLGETYPLDDHFAGKAILASLSAAELARYRSWCAVQGRSGGDSDGAFADIRRGGYATGERDSAGQTPIAFPVIWASGWLAAIAIEGPVFALGGTKAAELTEWRAIAAHIESLARTQGAIFGNPFPALDPDSFVL